VPDVSGVESMSLWCAFVVALFLCAAPALAQSGVSDTERAAFLQGQLDAKQAEGVGKTLAASCGVYASIINSPSYRSTLIIPIECDQFWTFVEIFGPRFWHRRVYPGVRRSFGGVYDRSSFHSYGWTRDEHDHEYFRRPPKTAPVVRRF
jgi:hypothetical protein